MIIVTVTLLFIALMVCGALGLAMAAWLMQEPTYGEVHRPSSRWDWLHGLHPFWWGVFAGGAAMLLLIEAVE